MRGPAGILLRLCTGDAGTTWLDASAASENILEAEDSTVPADRGGVAVMVLGYCTSSTIGDRGFAERGVSGYIAVYGVWVLCWSLRASGLV